jgi:hypothetical protein
LWSPLPQRVHYQFAFCLLKASFECHGAGEKLARLPPLDLLDLPDFELPVPVLLALPEVFSAGSEMDGRKLPFLSPPF